MLHKGRGMGPSVESAGNAGACAPRTGQVAGVGAAEINYHGMKPANIDDLARRAADMVKYV